MQMSAFDATITKKAEVNKKTYMTVFQSAKKAPVTRFFCGRCGTGGWYVYYPMPIEGRCTSLDFNLGTLDRESLEKVRVTHHVWWDYGIEWVQKWQTLGDGEVVKDLATDGMVHLPRHPKTDMGVEAKGWAHGSNP